MPVQVLEAVAVHESEVLRRPGRAAAGGNGAIAGVLALTGRNKVQEAMPPVPQDIVDSVKEDVQWTKSRAQQGRR